MALKIIGAGLSRTGTLSLKSALEQLGLAPCYHAAEIALPRPGCNDGHLDAWYAHYVHDAPLDWQWLLQKYQASLDAPACLRYRELMRAFPDARVVLTTRDPDDWFDSWQALWRALEEAGDTGKVVRFHKFVPLMRAVLARHFGGKIERAANIETFHRHNEAVRRDVPANRLLEYRVGEGWEPLCDFLGVATPDTPFPRLNDRNSTRELLIAALWTQEPLQV